MKTLEQMLNITGLYSEQHPHGGVIVYLGVTDSAPWYDLSDAKVMARISGPALHIAKIDQAACIWLNIYL